MTRALVPCIFVAVLVAIAISEVSCNSLEFSTKESELDSIMRTTREMEKRLAARNETRPPGSKKHIPHGLDIGKREDTYYRNKIPRDAYLKTKHSLTEKRDISSSDPNHRYKRIPDKKHDSWFPDYSGGNAGTYGKIIHSKRSPIYGTIDEKAAGNVKSIVGKRSSGYLTSDIDQLLKGRFGYN